MLMSPEGSGAGSDPQDAHELNEESHSSKGKYGGERRNRRERGRCRVGRKRGKEGGRKKKGVGSREKTRCRPQIIFIIRE